MSIMKQMGKKMTKCKSSGSHSQCETCVVINKYILVMQFENSFLSIKFYVYSSTDLGVLQHQAENPSHVLQKKKEIIPCSHSLTYSSDFHWVGTCACGQPFVWQIGCNRFLETSTRPRLHEALGKPKLTS